MVDFSWRLHHSETTVSEPWTCITRRYCWLRVTVSHLLLVTRRTCVWFARQATCSYCSVCCKVRGRGMQLSSLVPLLSALSQERCWHQCGDTARILMDELLECVTTRASTADDFRAQQHKCSTTITSNSPSNHFPFNLLCTLMSACGHDKLDPQLASSLPFDLVLRVISHIDCNTPEGRYALAACARSSRACRTTAENALYRYATFNPSRLTMFLLDVLGRGNGGQAARMRAKRLIGLIEHLTIWEGSDSPVVPITLLWEAAFMSPGAPLFPRVRSVALCSLAGAPSRVPWAPVLRPPLRDMPPATYIFGEIEVCICGLPAVGLLAYLPSKHMTSLTIHDMHCTWVEEHLIPWPWGACGSFRLYDGRPASIAWSPHILRRLEAKARALDSPPIHIAVYGAKWKPESLQNLARLDEEENFGQAPWGPVSAWRPSPANKVQLEWYDPEDPACPACVVCGKCGNGLD